MILLTLQLNGIQVVVSPNPSFTVILRIQIVFSKSCSGMNKREATSSNKALF